MKVEFYKHSVGDDEKSMVMECLDGIFLTTGFYVKEFEEKFSNYLGLRRVVGLTSCTAALHLSLLALGIGKGDEVITTPMTFIATATAIIHTGARPIFVDVEPRTGLIDPEKIEGAITKKTKAIIPVHLYGIMCDMKRIKRIADKYKLKIIEDAAHCIEGERDGIKPGQVSNVACFSFYATKNITSGEGGAIATNDEELADRIMILRSHGMTKEAAERYSGHYKHWDMIECGWKYNMDNIQAALLLPQLNGIDKLWHKRKKKYLGYVNKIMRIKEIKIPEIAERSKSAFHLFTIWVNPAKRDKILSELGDLGIGAAVNYRAIHLLKYFREQFKIKRGTFPVAEKIGDSTISLPFYPKIRDKEIDYVIESLKRILKKDYRRM